MVAERGLDMAPFIFFRKIYFRRFSSIHSFLLREVIAFYHVGIGYGKVKMIKVFPNNNRGLLLFLGWLA